MSSNARDQARQRLDRVQRFREELAELERERALTLTGDQRSRLDDHLHELTVRLRERYDLDTAESRDRTSWGMRIAALLGAAAFFAATTLLLHRVWGYMPGAVHVLILLSLPLVLLAGAELARSREVDRFYAGLLVIASGAAFVMTLNALGVIFNLTPTPHALLAWGAFSTLVAYAYGLRLALACGLLLLSAYSACLCVMFGSAYWGGFIEWPESLLPATAVVYFIPSFGRDRDPYDFGMVYRFCGAGLAILALLLLSLRGQGSVLPLAPDAVESLYQVISLALSAGVVFHGIRLGRSGLVNLGSGAFVTFLYVRLHSWWWAAMPKYLFFFLVGLIAVGLLYTFRCLRSRAAQHESSS